MPHFICPLCQSPLITDPKTWRCDGSQHPKHTSHPFDVARQGYVNLLPVNQKKSKAPGDSLASIMARKRFLAGAHYAPLQASIKSAVQEIMAKMPKQAGSATWLDIGCGEGYYTGAMAQAKMDTLIAADISKAAVTEVAKMAKQAGNLWYQGDNDKAGAAIYPIVTSAAHMPIKAGSITGISSIFSPILPKAFSEVLQDDGYLIIAKPDVDHLASMRSALFDEVREHDSDKFLEDLAPYFKVLKTHHVSADLSLNAAELADLLTMTPYSYRAKAANRAALLARAKNAPFMTMAKFVVYVLQKSAL